jgi:hypothetical protein
VALIHGHVKDLKLVKHNILGLNSNHKATRVVGGKTFLTLVIFMESNAKKLTSNSSPHKLALYFFKLSRRRFKVPSKNATLSGGHDTCLQGPLDDVPFFPGHRCSILNPKIEHEEMAIHDTNIGYNKHANYMDEGVGIQYFFAFMHLIMSFLAFLWVFPPYVIYFMGHNRLFLSGSWKAPNHSNVT